MYELILELLKQTLETFMGTKIMKKPMFKTFSLVCRAEVLPIARVKVAAFAIMYALEKWKQVQSEAAKRMLQHWIPHLDEFLIERFAYRL